MHTLRLMVFLLHCALMIAYATHVMPYFAQTIAQKDTDQHSGLNLLGTISASRERSRFRWPAKHSHSEQLTTIEHFDSFPIVSGIWNHCLSAIPLNSRNSYSGFLVQRHGEWMLKVWESSFAIIIYWRTHKPGLQFCPDACSRSEEIHPGILVLHEQGSVPNKFCSQ